MSKTEQDTLPDSCVCLKLKHYGRIYLVSGIPFAASILAPIFLGFALWLYAICIVIGCAWFTLVFLYVLDQARQEYIEFQKQVPCPLCSYPLINLPIPKCPECGVDLSTLEPTDEITS